MIEISVLFSLLFTAFCGVFVVAHSFQVGRLTLLDWSILAAGGMYGIGWILVLIVTQAGDNPKWEFWVTPFSSLYLTHTMAAFLLMGGILSGWYLPSKRFPLVRGVEDGDTGSNIVTWSLLCWLALLLALLLHGLYSKAYGGYFGIIECSKNIRSAQFENLPANPWSFLAPFGGLAMFSAYGFFGLWFSGRRNAGTFFGLIVASALSLLILYSRLGRIGFLVFLGTFILGWILLQRPRPLALIICAVVSFIVLLGAAFSVSVWLNLKPADSFAAFLARELAFPFSSFFAQLSHGENLYRGFVDLWMAPVYLLPSSLWTSWFEPVGQVNTTLIMGAPKGEGAVHGSIPVDLLTLGLMQLHLMGVPIVGALYGGLLRMVQFWLNRIPLKGVRAIFEGHLALKVAVLGVFYAEPDLIISANFGLIVGACLFWLICELNKAPFPLLHVRPRRTTPREY